MNERIRLLAEQAGILKEQTVKAKIVKNEDGSWTSILEYPDLERFAELIVEECINIADKSNTGSKSSNEGTEFYYNADIGDKIKQHFGINGMSTEDKKTLIKELLGVKND